MANLSQIGLRKKRQGGGKGLDPSLAVLSYIGSIQDTTNLTTYTFTAAAIGTAVADRLVIVAVTAGAANSRTIDSATIGGVAATLVKKSANSEQPTAIFSLLVAAGATADIEVTLNSGASRCTIHVYTLTGYFDSAAYDVQTATSGGTSVTTLTNTINIPPSGALVAAAGTAGNGSFSWSGATERDDRVVENGTYSSAGDSAMTGDPAHAVTPTYTSGRSTLTTASWR